MEKSKIFLVIQSESEESLGNETPLYIRHFTSFRYREIATPNKSARNDKEKLFLYAYFAKVVFTFARKFVIINYLICQYRGKCMNLKDYTLKIGYLVGGKYVEDSIEFAQVKGGYSSERFDLVDEGGEDAVKIVIYPHEEMKIELAELIYDHYFENKERFFGNGFQSWTSSREYKKGDVQYGLRSLSKLPIARDFSGASGDYRFCEYGRDLYHGFSYCYFRIDEKVELVGSLNERTGYTVFYADMRENVFVAKKDVEGLTIASDYRLFDLVRCQGGYDKVFDEYFALYPRKNTGRVDHLAGYTSWYNYYQNINEEIILRDLNGLKRAGDSANIFQIDDGYETKVGDWDIDEKKFPNGLKPIVDKIHEQGLKAGLWFAPFAAQFNADIVKTHPDWLVRDKHNRKLVSGAAWGGFFALDFEKEEVRDYIKAYFDKVFDEWGFDMVKLDFLYAAAILPRNNKTRGQLMCEAMDFLRECCRDKIILGCGVPLAPAFGVVDACRISCDVENTFKEKFYVKVTNQEIISAKMAMVNSVYRRHLNGRIWANDPDVFFLRDGGMKKAGYTMQQKRLLATVNHMFGNVLFVSDDIGEYDSEKMEILLDAYKKFDGKIVSAENIAPEIIKVVFEQGGKKQMLVFDDVKGDYIIQKAD